MICDQTAIWIEERKNMKEKNYLVYINDNQLYFGYVKNVCNCERCKERGEAEVFLNKLDDTYLDCIKYKEGYNFCDEIIYFGNELNKAICKIQEYYDNKIKHKEFENSILQRLIDLANDKMML